MKHLLLLIALPLILCAKVFTITPGTSIMKTMIKTHPGDTIKLAPGDYDETILVNSKVTVLGENPYSTRILGDGRRNAVELKSGASLKGVTVTKGGVGVFSEGRDISISNCIIIGNQRNGIMAVKVLPHIENTVIMSNSGFGIHAMGIKMVPKKTLLNLTISKNVKGGLYYDGTVAFELMESVFFKNGYKNIVNKATAPLISQSIIYPESKEFLKDNLSVKVSFRALKGKKRDYRIDSKLGEKGVIFPPQ